MFLRIRGKGASPENSQAAVMHLRGFRHIAVEVPHLLNTFMSIDSSVSYLDQRPFIFVHFATGIDAMTLMDRQCECFMTYAPNCASNHSLPNAQEIITEKSMNTFDEERRLVWKETWNLYDIVYDDVPLLPSSFNFTDNLLTQLSEYTERVCQTDFDTTNLCNQTDLTNTTNTIQHIEPVPSEFTRPSTWHGNSKAVVCTHYYAHEAMLAEHLEVQEVELLQYNTDTHHDKQTASCIHNQPSLQYCLHAKYSIQKDIIVLDLSNISKTSAGSHLALEMAWLAAFVTLQDCNYLFSARAIVVRLPYDHVPSVHLLQQVEEMLTTYHTESNSENETITKDHLTIDEESSRAQTNSQKREEQYEQEEEEKKKKKHGAANVQLHQLIQRMSRDDQINILNLTKITLEALDFLAEHLTLLHSSFVQIYKLFVKGQTAQKIHGNKNSSNKTQSSTYTSSSSDMEQENKKKERCNVANEPDEFLTRCNLTSPKICFIGRSEKSLQDTLTSLCVQGNNKHKNEKAASREQECNVVYVIGDHHEQQGLKQDNSTTPTHTSQHPLTQEKELSESYSQYISHMLQTIPCNYIPVTLVAPLQALINDDEEAWDPYVQRERARLNYCPCCSNCSHHHETGKSK